jgi:uncharacterized protein YndB with AHSA1/START domain
MIVMANSFFTTVLCMTSIVAAAQHTAADQSQTIQWPAGYRPEKSRFYVYNEIDIKASPATVWEILVRAADWPSWYKGAQNVKITPDSPVLAENSVLNWQTMGLRFASTIREFNPPYRLSWESKKSSIRGYHGWLIIPQGDGCKVITAEAQNGWLTFFEKLFQPKKLYRLHQEWLEGLKRLAEEKEGGKSYKNRKRI